MVKGRTVSFFTGKTVSRPLVDSVGKILVAYTYSLLARAGITLKKIASLKQMS